MDIERATPLLGGLSPEVFMRRHWQKKPLLVRQAIDPGAFTIGRERLFELAAAGQVRSRLIVQNDAGWTLRHGPFGRRALPPLKRARWTLLVQGVDRHDDAAHALLARFRFVPQARLDDVMVSYASDQGGVGPHFDSYDVFLVQLHGHRRWRIGRLQDPALQADVPLKILTRFVAEEEWLLAPGDMLYLPPRWAHDGVAEGECITASIGFRAPRRDAIARDVLQRMLEAEPQDADADLPVYRDPGRGASVEPGRIPEALGAFAGDALRRLVDDPRSVACALGEVLSEPDREVHFAPGRGVPPGCGVVLDRCSRMLYDRWHVFINGESYLASGRDAALMRRLADRTQLAPGDVAALGDAARELLQQWLQAGWLRPAPPPPIARRKP